MANITKVGKQKYKVRVSKQSHGRREFFNFTFRGEKADAKIFAREKETELDAGLLTKNTGITFEAYFEKWLKAIKPKVAPRTYEGYESYIRRYAFPSLSKIILKEIERHHVQDIYIDMQETLSPTTVRNLHAGLRACFNYAKKHEYIRSNPCDKADLPAKRRKQINVLTFEEALAFSNACLVVPNGIIFEFAVETGMRPEEYLALRWEDIRGDQVSVQQVVQYRRTKGLGGFYFAPCKTPKSRRRVPISEALRLRLKQHRTEQLKRRLKIKQTWQDHDLVFANEIGNPFELTNVTRRYFRPLLKAIWPDLPKPEDEWSSGVEPETMPNPDYKALTLYSLRHTCATLLLMAGENSKVVADRLGHASVTMTLDTYSHVLPHIQADATATISKIMRG